MKNNLVQITESPRDAMQGLIPFIPTVVKAAYINTLLKVGFDTIDFGSFVSPNAIPQLKDTAEVLKKLDLASAKSKLLAIIGNLRGAETAIQFDEIDYLGYPYSPSPTFLKLNINSSVREATTTIQNIQNLCVKNNKHFVVFYSMAFGNPYGDAHNNDVVADSIHHLLKLGIKKINLADTLGIGKAETISSVYSQLTDEFKTIDFGLHLHVSKKEAEQKIDAAYKAGCRRFDSAILGLGGCPMSSKKMVGNIDTGRLVNYLEKNSIQTSLIKSEFNEAIKEAGNVFGFVNRQ